MTDDTVGNVVDLGVTYGRSGEVMGQGNRRVIMTPEMTSVREMTDQLMKMGIPQNMAESWTGRLSNLPNFVHFNKKILAAVVAMIDTTHRKTDELNLTRAEFDTA